MKTLFFVCQTWIVKNKSHSTIDQPMSSSASRLGLISEVLLAFPSCSLVRQFEHVERKRNWGRKRTDTNVIYFLRLKVLLKMYGLRSSGTIICSRSLVVFSAHSGASYCLWLCATFLFRAMPSKLPSWSTHNWSFFFVFLFFTFRFLAHILHREHFMSLCQWRPQKFSPLLSIHTINVSGVLFHQFIAFVLSARPAMTA